MSIAVFGSINMDVTAYMDRLPKPGETLHAEEYKLGLGGKGANQAVAARKLGSDVHFICRLGADDFSKPAERELASYGVDLSLLKKDPQGATGIAIIKVSASGENFITVVGGSNLAMDETDVTRATPALEKASVLLLQLEVPTAASLAAAAIVKARGGTVILDPAPAPAGGISSDILKAVDIITPNETEAGLILGWQPQTPEEGLKAARELRDRGVATAVVKLGSRGLAVAGQDLEAIIPAFKVATIDTVAAGDCFNGGLAHALEQGLTLEAALRYAAATAALSTTKKGASSAAPTKAEVEAFLRGA
jgi:ribokinase